MRLLCFQDNAIQKHYSTTQMRTDPSNVQLPEALYTDPEAPGLRLQVLQKYTVLLKVLLPEACGPITISKSLSKSKSIFLIGPKS